MGSNDFVEYGKKIPKIKIQKITKNLKKIFFREMGKIIQLLEKFYSKIKMVSSVKETD